MPAVSKLPIVVLRHYRNSWDAALCGARGSRLTFVMQRKAITCPRCFERLEAFSVNRTERIKVQWAARTKAMRSLPSDFKRLPE